MYVNENPNLFNINQHEHHYRTRNNISNLYQYPIHRTALFESGPYYNGLKLHNSLPISIKDSVNFSSSLREYLLNHCFYSTDEFHLNKERA